MRMIDNKAGSILSNVFLFGDNNSAWETHRLTEVLKSNTIKSMGVKMTNRLYRHTAIAIDRQHIRPEALDSDGERSDSDEDDGNVHDTMAAHSKRLADLRYARVKNLTGNLTPETIQLFRGVCDRTHSWLNMSSRDAKPLRLKHVSDLSITIRDKPKQIERIMTDVYGFNWKWKSEQQRDAVERMVAGVSPLFVILPTGGGKTLCFLVASKMEGTGVTVIITPLIALGNDLVKRFKESDVDVVLYKGRGQRKAKVVVVVTETARMEHFQEYIMELQREARLERIVYDEAHKLVSDQVYRPYIALSKQLRVRCQLAFITGTCPSEMVDDLCKEMVVSNPHVIRAQYYKPKFIYSVKVCVDITKDLRTMISHLASERPSEAKILIFCHSRNDVCNYAREYNARQYYGGQPTNELELKSWSRGLMFATSALGAGVDIEGIQDVIHVNSPYGMLDYVQESGRGGRGGEVVRCIVLLRDKDYEKFMEVPREQLTPDLCALQEFLPGDVCRNKVITSYLNGTLLGKTCVELGGKLCDICLTSSNDDLKRRQEEEGRLEVQEVKRRKVYENQVIFRQLEARSVEETWDTINVQLRKIGTGCMICWYEGKGEEHILKDCPRWKEVFPQTDPGLARTKVDFRKIRNSCWSCTFPGDRCLDFQNKRKCTRKVQLFAIVMYYWQAKGRGYYDVIHRTMGREYGTIEDLAAGLILPARILEENGTLGFKVWVEMLLYRLERM